MRHAAFSGGLDYLHHRFASTDFNLWPEFSRILLVLLMFIGACAGSTGGAIKCSRVLLLLKCIRREIRQVVHPRSVNVVKLDGRVVDEDSLRSVQLFLQPIFSSPWGPRCWCRWTTSPLAPPSPP